MYKFAQGAEMKKTHVIAIFLIVLAAVFSAAVYAEEPTEAEALPIKLSGASEMSTLTDGKESTYIELSEGTELTLISKEGIGIASLYAVFDKIPGEWTLSDGEVTKTCGENGYLHEYIDVDAIFGYAPTTLYLIFDRRDISVSEITALAVGELPSWVQVWEKPLDGRADLMLCSTHSDDEQLFFAGVLPYFAGELGLNVQVVYFTSPFIYHERPHEQLNGLWEVGVRAYPIYGDVVDHFSESKSVEYAFQEKYGITKDDMIAFQVEMLRRFRPLVVIGHDFAGEYSHGQHMINTETLVEALEITNDASKYPESADKYGVWDVPKTYIHLYEENKIVMNWDEPLESFGGKTAFQVTQDGFKHHKSQHWTWFNKWIYGKNNPVTKATQIKTYSPCLYGLYRTTVGLDTGIGDMFEHIKTYAVLEEERLEAEEESRRAESESLSIAESERLESESIWLEESRAESESIRLEEESRAEESRREESESKAESESVRLEEEKKQNKEKRSTVTVITVICVAFAAISVAVVSVRMNAKKKRKLRRKRRF